MQTFLPYEDFHESARVLDRQRLGKQRVEAWLLLKQLLEGEGGWLNHPAAKMWRGYEAALAKYGLAMILHWRARGYRDTRAELIWQLAREYDLVTELLLGAEMPPWLGDKKFHESHQSNLVRKKPEFYRPVFPDVADDLPYTWPNSRR